MFALLKTRLLAAAFVLLAASSAGATPATYRFTGDIVGTLDGAAVSGLLTLDVVGDTDDLVLSPPAQLLAAAVATFSLPGSGDFTVTNTFYAFARPDLARTGFGVNGIPDCCDIIGVNNSVLAGYDMNDPIGPVSAATNPSIADFHDIPTSAGLFSVTAMRNVTFQALIGGTVPEPGLPALLWVAAAAAVLARRRTGAGARR